MTEFVGKRAITLVVDADNEKHAELLFSEFEHRMRAEHAMVKEVGVIDDAPLPPPKDDGLPLKGSKKDS